MKRLLLIFLNILIVFSEECTGDADACANIMINPDDDYICCERINMDNREVKRCYNMYISKYEGLTDPFIKEITREEVGDSCKGAFTTECIDEDYNNYEYICSGKRLTEYNTFSEEEQNFINQEETCLAIKIKIINKSIAQDDVTLDLCKNGKLLQTSKNAGFKCGLYNYKITSGEGGNVKICYFLHKDVLQGGDISRDLFNNMLFGYTGQSGLTYELEIITSDGLEASYDSTTNKVTKHLKSNFYKVSKLLLFLMGLLSIIY